MFKQIKSLGADTAIYGISSIIARLLNFILVPFYTNIFLPSEYGIVATVYSYIAFFNVLYSYGMESAYFRYAGIIEIGNEKENYSTPFISVALSSFLFSIIMLVCAVPLTAVFQVPETMYPLIRYTAGILFFDAISIIPFASLRLQRKAKLFAAFRVINIVLSVLLNLFTILVLRWGIEGILFSNLCASIATFLLLLPTIARQFVIRFHKRLFRELLRFGLPIVPVGISGVILQIADRPIMSLLMDSSSVGIYQANYRLGIFMNAIVGMFEYAWRPFFLSHARDSNAKQLFSRVMTYFLLGTFTIFLVISFFINDVIHINVLGHHLISKDYWPGLNIVPWILLGYIFSGIGTNLNAGIQIEKKTVYLLPTSLSGSVTNVILNFLLIPIFGIMGAAYATTAGYAAVAISLYIVVQRFYYIEYEFKRIAKLLVTVAVTFAVYILFDLSVLTKLLLVVTWALSLFFIGFFNDDERRAMMRIISRKTA